MFWAFLQALSLLSPAVIPVVYWAAVRENIPIQHASQWGNGLLQIFTKEASRPVLADNVFAKICLIRKAEEKEVCKSFRFSAIKTQVLWFLMMWLSGNSWTCIAVFPSVLCATFRRVSTTLMIDSGEIAHITQPGKLSLSYLLFWSSWLAREAVRVMCHTTSGPKSSAFWGFCPGWVLEVH